MTIEYIMYTIGIHITTIDSHVRASGGSAICKSCEGDTIHGREMCERACVVAIDNELVFTSFAKHFPLCRETLNMFVNTTVNR